MAERGDGISSRFFSAPQIRRLKMKAMNVHEFGGPEVLKLEECLHQNLRLARFWCVFMPLESIPMTLTCAPARMP
jgi:hypothetical protein